MRISTTPTKELVNTGMEYTALRITNAEKLGHILTSGLYADPLDGTIREVLSNAVDSHTRLLGSGQQPPRPIELYIDTATNSLVISDCGTGIQPDQVEYLALGLGSSDKDTGNEEIGGWGLGFKAPYALSEAWTFENRWQGTISYYSCVIKDEQLSFSRIAVQDTNLPNGVTVRVPLPQKDQSRATMLARYYARFLTQHSKGLGVAVAEKIVPPLDYISDAQTVVVERTRVSYRFYDKEKGSIDTPISKKWSEGLNSWQVATRGKHAGAIATVGGVPYCLAEQGLESGDEKTSIWSLPFHVTLPVGLVDVTPSRDSLRLSPRTKKVMAQLSEELLTGFSDTAYNAVCKARTLKELHEAFELAAQMGEASFQRLAKRVTKEGTPSSPYYTYLPAERVSNYTCSLGKHNLGEYAGLLIPRDMERVGHSQVLTRATGFMVIKTGKPKTTMNRWSVPPSCLPMLYLPDTKSAKYSQSYRASYFNTNGYDRQSVTKLSRAFSDDKHVLVVNDLIKGGVQRIRYNTEWAARTYIRFITGDGSKGLELGTESLPALDWWEKHIGIKPRLASTVAFDLPVKSAGTSSAVTSGAHSPPPATQPSEGRITGTKNYLQGRKLREDEFQVGGVYIETVRGGATVYQRSDRPLQLKATALEQLVCQTVFMLRKQPVAAERTTPAPAAAVSVLASASDTTRKRFQEAPQWITVEEWLNEIDQWMIDFSAKRFLGVDYLTKELDNDLNKAFQYWSVWTPGEVANHPKIVQELAEQIRDYRQANAVLKENNARIYELRSGTHVIYIPSKAQNLQRSLPDGVEPNVSKSRTRTLERLAKATNWSKLYNALKGTDATLPVLKAYGLLSKA